MHGNTIVVGINHLKKDDNLHHESIFFKQAMNHSINEEDFRREYEHFYPNTTKQYEGLAKIK